jgi:hypothetical protein
MANLGWFQEVSKTDLPSDNWWWVEDFEGRKGLLYVVRFMSENDKPERVPNEPNALERLHSLDQEHTLSLGPFIALAEASDSTVSASIKSIRVWDVASKLPLGLPKIAVEDLGVPIFECEAEVRQAGVT